MRTARASEPSIAVSRSSAAQTSSAPPTAWTQRAPTSTPNDGASPQTSDAAANTSVPTTKAATGRRRAAYAAGTAASASPRLYDVSTQATCGISTSNRRRMSGRASVTTEESASASPIPSPTRALRRLEVIGQL